MTRWRTRDSATLLAVLYLFISYAFADGLNPGAPLSRIGRDQICVTNGAVSALPDGRLAIQTASSRGVVPGSDGTIAEIHFRYLGPTVGLKPLASGQIRRQVGVKLQAQDACNLLYVMWHITPDSKIEVSIKKNPAQHTSAECHAGGYTILKPSRIVAMPPIHPGEAHTMRVTLDGDNLVVIADRQEAWIGTINGGLDGIDGPAGFRTDNARFEVEFFAVFRASGNPSDANSDTNRCTGGRPT